MRGAPLAFSILVQHIAPESLTFSLYLPHVVLVTDLALRLARNKGLSDDSLLFIEEAGLLHDIGIVGVSDLELGCTGSEPYIRHGVIGGQILREYGLERHALVAERHTGVGITAEEIRQQELPLPEQDFLPLSVEEQLICYTDLFFSKDPQKLWDRKTPEQVRAGLAHFGEEKTAIFDRWSAEYGL